MKGGFDAGDFDLFSCLLSPDRSDLDTWGEVSGGCLGLLHVA